MISSDDIDVELSEEDLRKFEEVSPISSRVSRLLLAGPSSEEPQEAVFPPLPLLSSQEEGTTEEDIIELELDAPFEYKVIDDDVSFRSAFRLTKKAGPS